MYSSALERKETRGMHKHLDYPELDTNQQHYLISGGLDKVWVKAEPLSHVEIRDIPSGSREDSPIQKLPLTEVKESKVTVGVGQ
jgi:hypothetical protein